MIPECKFWHTWAVLYGAAIPHKACLDCGLIQGLAIIAGKTHWIKTDAESYKKMAKEKAENDKRAQQVSWKQRKANLEWIKGQNL